MIQLDNSFLEKVGLGLMPEEQKVEFLQHLHEQLQTRVGIQLADGLSNEQLDEFEKIIDGDKDEIRHWVTVNEPNYLQDPLFQRMHKESGIAANDPRLVAEYTATKWLEKNRPNYKQVVESIVKELEQEISDNREAFLS